MSNNRSVQFFGVLLISIGFISGYMAHVLISSDQNSSTSMASIQGANSTGVTEPGVLNKRIPVSSERWVVKTQKKEGRVHVPDHDSIQKVYDQDVTLLEVLEKRTSDIDHDIGGWEDDQGDGDSRLELASDAVVEHEAEYHQRLQEQAETDVQLFPSELGPDEDDEENFYLNDDLEEVDEEEVNAMLGTDEFNENIQYSDDRPPVEDLSSPE